MGVSKVEVGGELSLGVSKLLWSRGIGEIKSDTGAMGTCGVFEVEKGRLRKRVELAGRGQLGLCQWNCSMRSLYAVGMSDSGIQERSDSGWFSRSTK